ncbi:sensor histidine kinase [Parathalassolituus penaei]|uniref:histidine kinase n=1 Tax=Parathalassolituus penaei TaxID=2997323 RepID=A0A9X3EHS9_9GAMM|nr:ATP-binding protein [Parathalassolituus penaei]MCY0966985.1 ATP-binding protein [Parathalassolituus penaei]
MGTRFTSVESKLTIYVLLFSILVGVLFSGVQIRKDYVDDHERFHQQLDNQLAYQSRQLGLALQQYHTEAIEAIFEGLLLNPAVVAVTIHDSTSGYELSGGQTADQRRQLLFEEQEVPVITIDPMSGAEVQSGVLKLWLDTNRIHQGFRERALVTAAIEVARNAFLALVLIVVLRERLTRPIKELTEHIRQLDPASSLNTKLEANLQLHEFDELVAKINSLLQAIDSEMVQRREAEQKAHYLNDKLEEKVKARTQELRDSNSRLQNSLNELQRTQRMLLQAQRMASLGHLAAGIAHEINNPVAVVYSNIATLSEYLTELIELAEQYQAVEADIADAAIRQSLETMRRAIDIEFVRDDAPELVQTSQQSLERVRNIVSELRTFADCEGQAKVAVNLAELMRQAVAELRLDAVDNIRLDTYMEGLPTVDAIPGQLRLVFRNILHNAQEAIVGNGRIEVAAEEVADGIRIVVKDSGMGMSPEDLSCAINPFFTRKEIGKGTGLGLTVAYNIMANHGGSLEIESEKGKGTSVILLLPFVG